MRKIKIYLTVFVLIIKITIKGYGQGPDYNQLVYNWSAPQVSGKFPAILVIGGSEGGLGYGLKWAELLNAKGFGVMSLAYFGTDGLNSQLEEIPLEYFQKALDTLESFKGVDSGRIAIISVSKGTEAASLLSAENPEIRLLVLASPSHAVWQCINRVNYGSFRSSWTKNGKPLPFAAYDYSKGYYPVVNFYLGAIEKPLDPGVLIPIEKIHAKLIVLSGGEDMVWPSSAMAEKISERYLTGHKGQEIIFRDYPEAGHGFLLPYRSASEKAEILGKIKKNLNFLGGSAEAFEKAMDESLSLVLGELNTL
jgi:uncharacterized protein